MDGISVENIVKFVTVRKMFVKENKIVLELPEDHQAA